MCSARIDFEAIEIHSSCWLRFMSFVADILTIGLPVGQGAVDVVSLQPTLIIHDVTINNHEANGRTFHVKVKLTCLTLITPTSP